MIAWKDQLIFKVCMPDKPDRFLDSRVAVQGGSNMTGTNCDLFTHKSSRSYLNHLVYVTGRCIRANHVKLIISTIYTAKFVETEQNNRKGE
jgi:hypothetical protein